MQTCTWVIPTRLAILLSDPLPLQVPLSQYLFWVGLMLGAEMGAYDSLAYIKTVKNQSIKC